jgi:small subunit ribosomal protein S7
MFGGKKTTAQRIVYGALEKAEQEMHRPGIQIFEQAIKNTSPVLEVKSRRVGGATYQVPTEVRPTRRLALFTARLRRPNRRCTVQVYKSSSRPSKIRVPCWK